MTEARHPGVDHTPPEPDGTGHNDPPPHRPLLPSRRGLLVVGVAAVAAVVLLAAGGWWAWQVVRPRVVSGTVQAIVLDTEEVSRITGADLTAEARTGEPSPALAADPLACEVAVGPATRAVYGRAWTAFLSVTHQESDEVADHVVTQVIGRYSEAEQSAKAFRILTDGVKACPQAVRTDQNANTSTWAYQVEESTSDALRWTAAQDAAEGWTCHREARLSGVSLVQVAVCQAGNGRPAATRIGDRLAARIEG